MLDPIDDAIYQTVHEFRDGDRTGAVALAPKVNMNAGTLSNKVNAFCDTHHLSLKESVPIQLATGRFDILRAYAQSLGFAVVRVTDLSHWSDIELLDSYAAWNAEIGETHGAIRRALEDGNITRTEINEIESEMYQDFERALGVLQRLRSLSR